MQFCARNQVATNTFNRYMQRYSGQPNKVEPKQQLVAVEIIDNNQHGAEVAVVLRCGVRVEVGRGFDVPTLRQVVAALEP